MEYQEGFEHPDEAPGTSPARTVPEGCDVDAALARSVRLFIAEARKVEEHSPVASAI